VAFLQAVIINVSKVWIGLFHPVATVLVVLSALANGLRALMMMLFARKSNYKQSTELQDNQLPIKELAKKHRDFPLFRAPEFFLNAVSQGLPVLLLTTFFGPASAGFYTIGRTVLRLPTQLIGKSVGDVFYPRISEA